MSSPTPPVPLPPPSATGGSVGGVLGGGVLIALGVATLALPYLLFLVGGGGDTEAFDDFARSALIPGAVIIVAGVIVLVSGVVRASRSGVGAGRILSAVALPLAVLLPPAGLILGYAARGRIRREGQPDGLSTGAIVIGWIGTAFAALVLGLVLLPWVVGSSVQY